MDLDVELYLLRLIRVLLEIIFSKKYDDIDLVILIDASSRISYRTNKENINVADFASNFGGGGHKCASGSKFDNENRINILKDYFGDVKELEENC